MKLSRIKTAFITAAAFVVLVVKNKQLSRQLKIRPKAYFQLKNTITKNRY